MGSSTLLSVLGSLHGLSGLEEEVLEFEGLDQVGVPYERSVLDTDVLVESEDILKFLTTYSYS